MIQRIACVLIMSAVANAADGPPGAGKGRGENMGMGKGRGPDPALRSDQDDFHYLLNRHSDIRRSVTNTPSGVETLTESEAPEVAARLKKHVAAMKKRMESGHGLRWWDPLFAALFKDHSRIRMEVRETAKGVAVTETSIDPRVVPLIQAHAGVVSLFVKHGFDEAEKAHPIPATPTAGPAPKLLFPVVPNVGGIVWEPGLAEPPQAGTKALFDIAGVGKPEDVLPGVERVARLLNLAAAAGLNPADVKIAVVLHGDALRAALKDDAHRAKFGIANPHAALLPVLRKHGVEIAACAQSLARAGFARSQLAEGLSVAASAMTYTLTRQQQGFGVLVFR